MSSVKKLKTKQRGPWCGWCKPKTTRAVYSANSFRDFACEQHKPELEAAVINESTHMTEADYNSWWGL